MNSEPGLDPFTKYNFFSREPKKSVKNFFLKPNIKKSKLKMLYIGYIGVALPATVLPPIFNLQRITTYSPKRFSNYSKVYEVPPNTTKVAFGPVKMEGVFDIFTLVEDVIPQYWPQCRVKTLYPLPMEQMGQVLP